MNPIDLVAPATMAGRRAHKKAAEFQDTVKSRHTYYSVVSLHLGYPGPKRALMEWTFSTPGRWIGQEPRCGHLTAAGAWLGYGPLFERKPGGLMTFRELRNRPTVFGSGMSTRDVDEILRSGTLTPAGV